MSRRNAYILSGLGLVALLAGFWFLLLSPIMSSIEETDKQIEAESEALQVAQTKLAQLEQYQVEAKQNQSRQIELAKMVPLQEEIPSLILQVQDLAAEAGIDFLTIAPASQTGSTTGGPVTGYNSVALQLTMAGEFFDINDFLYRAEQMVSGPGRLLRVASLSLSNSEEGTEGQSPNLDAAIVLDAYTRIPAAAATTPAPVPGTPESTPGAVEANTTNSAG
jgi:Tfp pilus assembly protein PilO